MPAGVQSLIVARKVLLTIKKIDIIRAIGPAMCNILGVFANSFVK